MTRLITLALSSGALISAAHRPWPGTGYLALVAVIPLLLALDSAQRWWRGALAGWLAALGSGLVAFEGVAPAELWAYPVLVTVAGLPWAAAGALFVVLRKHMRGRAGLWLIVPLLLAAEFIPAQRFLFGDFANGLSAIGYTQFGTPLLAAAGWSGVSGVSLLVLAVNMAILLALRRQLLGAAVTLAVLFLAVLLPVPGSDERQASDPLRVAIVQGAVPSVDTLLARFDRQAAGRMLEPYADLTDQAGEHGAELVIWGETVIPHAVRPGHVPAYVTAALEPAPVALVGGVSFSGHESFNSIFHWADGELTEIYRKRALVPFNERHYSPGPAMPALDVNGLSLGLGVCLDSVFNTFARESVRAGAEALVYVTEDSFAVNTVTPELHLRVTAFRAAETGRYVLFANQSGPSALIDNHGRVIERINHGRTAALLGDLPAYRGATPFALFGDWAGIACSVFALAGLPLRLLSRRRDVADPVAGGELSAQP